MLSYVKRAGSQAYYITDTGDAYELTPGILLSLLQGGDGLSRELSLARQADALLAAHLVSGCPEQDDSVELLLSDAGLLIRSFTTVKQLMTNLTSGAYLTLEVWANRCGKSVAAAKRQCSMGRVRFAVKIGGIWLVPVNAEYPVGRMASGVQVLQAPDCCLTETAMAYLDAMDFEPLVRSGLLSTDTCWPCHVDKRPDDGILYRLSDFPCSLQPGDRQYLPESLFNLLKYANYNDYEEIELVDTSVCNQLLVSAWLADGKSVYEPEQGEPMEDGFSLDDALRFAVNRSRTAAVSPTSEGCFGS